MNRIPNILIPTMHTPYIEVVKTSGMGRGVFALKAFKPGEIIEVCPVILIPNEEGSPHNPTQEYSFRWSPKFVAIALGAGSLYNHSYEPNAYVTQDTRKKELSIICHKPIARAEQIFFNYNGEPDCKDELWFTAKPVPKKDRRRP